MAYASALKEIAGGASEGKAGPPGPPDLPNTGSALGAPLPTGIGSMDTGDALSPRAAASATISELAKLKSHFPSAEGRIDGIIAEITALQKDASDKKAAIALKPPMAPATVMPPPPAAPPMNMPPPPMGGAPPMMPPPGGGMAPPPIG